MCYMTLLVLNLEQIFGLDEGGGLRYLHLGWQRNHTWFCQKHESLSLCSGRHMLRVQFRTSLESKLWTAVVKWKTTENSVSHNSPCILLTGHANNFLSFSSASPFILICYVWYYNVLLSSLAETRLEILCYESQVWRNSENLEVWYIKH